MVSGLTRVPARRRSLAAMPGGHVRFHADNGLDSFLLALVIELDGPVHTAVVGDGDRIHAEIFRPLHQLIDAAGAVQQGVMRVDVQVNKTGSRHLTLRKGQTLSAGYTVQAD